MSNQRKHDGYDQSREGTHTPARDAMIEQFLTFTIGEEEYGVDIMTVREIKG